MKEFNYDVSTARKNPFAEKLKKEGYTIIIDYKPEYSDKKQKIKNWHKIRTLLINQVVANNSAHSKNYFAHLRRGIAALNEGKGVEHEIIR